MMRTYSRKRTECKELENVTEICRLCLEKPDESVPIYSDNTKLYSSLALRIMICVGLEIGNEEYMPNIICTQCHKDVQTFYSFRKSCARSYQKLKSHIQAMKLREHKERQNSMFTINPDGSILLRDDNNSIMTDNEPLVTLTKMLYDGDKGANSEVLLKTEHNVANVDNSIVSNELVVKTQDQQTLPNQALAVFSVESKEHIVPEANLPPDPELSDFLSTVLTELGVLTRHGDGLLDLGPKTSRTLDLETRDGNNITFELVEEVDELQNGSEECPVQENNVNSNSSLEEIHLSTVVSTNGWRSGAKCTQCGKMLANRGVLARHVRNVHKRARPHLCPTCGKSFAQKEVMRRHMLLHQEKRPFQCEKCPKSFTQRAALQMHSRLHAAPQERALTLHQCPHCPKMFLYASGLSRHLLTHSNTAFACAECGRRFFDKSSLKRHQRTMRHDGNNTNGHKEDATNKDDTLALCTPDKMAAPAPTEDGR